MAQENKEKTLNERLAEQAKDQGYTSSKKPETPSKNLTGYRIVIALLAVILVAVSGLYYSIHNQQQEDYALLSADRDKVQGNLTSLIADYDKAQTTNKELKVNMEIERNRADSVITALKNERSLNYAKLKRYEREVGTLRSIMRGYLQQIDSLNNLNQQLISENVTFKKRISKVELRAEEAEERAKELDNKVKEGSRLRAESITITAFNAKGHEMSRVKKADRLSINFTIVANKLAKPGNKEIFARITSPDGYVLTTEQLPTFNFNGEKLTYSATREVDYQNASLPVSIYYAGSGFVEGVYLIELYHANYMIGSSKIEVK